MRLPMVLCFAFGCGFASRSASDGGSPPGGDVSAPQLDARAADAALPDAAELDGAGSGAGPGGPGGANDCFQAWIDHTVQFTGLRQMSELSTVVSAMITSERDPWISDDGLRLYFSRSRGSQGGSDIYLATRTATTASFGNAVDLVNLSGPSDDDRPALSADELTIVIAKDPTNNSGKARVVLARRDRTSAVFPSPDEMLTKMTNVDNQDNLDPFLSRDGLRLYVAPTASGGLQQIMMATRESTAEAFSAPVAVRGVDRSNVSDADPAVSGDDRILVFSSVVPGRRTDLWYATRPTPSDDFGTPLQIDGVGGTADDGDPMLSADGCELYFSSNRSGVRHIYRADVKR